MSQYPFDGLTGGGDALDGIPYAGLNALSKAYGVDSSIFHVYEYDPANNNTTNPELSPFVIVSNDNTSGFGAWVLVSLEDTITVNISNAQIKALAATPVELVPAPGAGYLIEFLSLVLFINYGGGVLAEPSAPDDLAVEYDDGTGTQIETWDTTGFITTTADAMEIIHSGGVKGAASAIPASTNVNKNIVLINTGGEYTGAASTSTIIVKVSYKIHKTGL